MLTFFGSVAAVLAILTTSTGVCATRACTQKPWRTGWFFHPVQCSAFLFPASSSPISDVPHFSSSLADLLHKSDPKVKASLAEVKRLVPYQSTKDQVRSPCSLRGLHTQPHSSCTVPGPAHAWPRPAVWNSTCITQQLVLRL